MKFLVADDHHLIREGLRYALEGAFDDLLIREAANGDQVLSEVAKSPNLDLVLLDYFMPDTDGYELVSELCRRHAQIPVIILSAADDPLLMQKLLELGAAGYLSKATDHEAIVDAIRHVLAGGIYVPENTPGVRPNGARPGPAAFRETRRLLERLTQRQRQVLRFMAHGMTNKDISRELSVSENTVKVHVTAILKALGVSNRTQAVLMAQRLGFPGELG